jgi:aspartyl/asparaginyl beta-hydroxylase (cupin superfamily)
MQLSRQEADGLFQSGVEALRQGRASDARQLFERLTGAGATGELPWLLLAIARREDNDPGGEEAALNRLLQDVPRSVRGNILKGDCRANAGDNPAAIHFYQNALRLAEGLSLPPEVMDDVRGAEESLAELQRQSHAQREARLNERGLPAEQWSPRFAHALDLAAGKRKQYLQLPTAFTYPELPQRQYYEAAEFDWAPAVESATPAIRAELEGLLAAQGTDEFRAYIQAGSDELRMDQNRGLLDNRDWSALFLCENGWAVPKVIERCPNTWEAMMQAPLPRISGWGPTVMFSLLKGGARIAPHTGMFNTRLICHLPLIVPLGCRFRVGNEVREWQPGKLLIFDDTIEHEAWNDSGEDRVILIFDIWRPELSEQERGELTALFSD